MTVSKLDQAFTQVTQIDTFCAFCARLPLPPVTMPPDAVRAAGLDPDIWHGLGIVGLWAALDAFTERGHQRPSGTRLVDWLTCDAHVPHLPSDLAKAVRELDDMRNLYAHNFGGLADDVYFARQRNVFKRGESYRLSSDTGSSLTASPPGTPSSFGSQRLTLTLDDLQFYIKKVHAILRIF